MSVVAVRVGAVVNLIIRFGDQTRLKCAACTKYVKPPTAFDEPISCACGVSYRNVGPSEWVVWSVP